MIAIPYSTLLGFLLLSFLICFCYWPSRKGEFLYDDVLLQNYDRVQKALWRELATSSTRVLTWLSYGLNVWWFGPTQGATGWHLTRALFGFHFINMALHLTNACLVWWIASILRMPFPIVAGLIFSLHPLASMGVSYISGRASVLSTTLGLLSLATLLSGDAPVSILFLYAACLAKEDAVALTALLTVLGWLWSIPLWWIFIPPAIFTLVWKWRVFVKLFHNNGEVGMVQSGFPGVMKSPTYQLTAIGELGYRLPLWAVGLHQCADPQIGFGRATRVMGLVGAVYLSSVVAIGDNDQALMTGALMIVLSPLIPYLIVPMPDPISEQRAYFAVGGVALLLAHLPLFVILPLCAWFIFCTHDRAKSYVNPEAFWKRVIKDGGRTDRALSNLGTKAMELGKKDEARAYFHQVLDLDPQLSIARCNLALMDQNEQNFGGALEQFQEAVKRTPNYYQAWYFMGCLLDHMKRPAEAEAAYRRCLDIQSWPPAWNRLGIRAAVNGKASESLQFFEKAVNAEPHDPNYIHNIGTALRLLGRAEEALPYMKKLPPQYQATSEMLLIMEQKPA